MRRLGFRWAWESLGLGGIANLEQHESLGHQRLSCWIRIHCDVGQVMESLRAGADWARSSEFILYQAAG